MSDCTVSRLPQASCINIRVRPGDTDALEAIATALQQTLPLEPNSTTDGRHRIYWLGPDEWLVVSSPDVAPLDALHDAASNRFIAINDQSGGTCHMRVSGAGARQLLSKGCTLDLHDSAFPPGNCAQSNLAKANVLIGYSSNDPVYEIIVRRSFCDYLESWLSQHARVRHDLASCSSGTSR